MTEVQPSVLSGDRLRQQKIHWLTSRLAPGEELVVQERVLGSRSLFLCDGESVVLRTDTAALPAEDVPRIQESLLTRYRAAVFRLHSNVVRIYGGAPKVSVHGKIIGGNYPRGCAAALYAARSMSQAVYYSPRFEFYAFDITVDDGRHCSFMPLVSCNHLLEREHFLYARTLFKGELTDCLHFPTDFPTNIPFWLSLPSIPGNSCLGTVVRPVVPVFGPGGNRVLIHNPNARFLDNPANSSCPESGGPRRSPVCEELLSLVDRFVTQDRLFSVLARIPSLTFPRDRSRVIAQLCHSAVEDFFEQCSTRYDVLSAKEKHIITREFNLRSAQLLFLVMKV